MLAGQQAAAGSRHLARADGTPTALEGREDSTSRHLPASGRQACCWGTGQTDDGVRALCGLQGGNTRPRPRVGTRARARACARTCACARSHTPTRTHTDPRPAAALRSNEVNLKVVSRLSRAPRGSIIAAEVLRGGEPDIHVRAHVGRKVECHNPADHDEAKPRSTHASSA